jgi:dienelactone hydrolase
MSIVARRLTQEADGIPGYMAHPDAPGQRPGVLMAHHAHGITGDYKLDAYRLAELGWNVLVPSFFNMFGCRAPITSGPAPSSRKSTGTGTSSRRWTRPGAT